MRSFVFLIFAALTLGGCATVPESIQVADNTPLVEYQAVAMDPDRTRDQAARWGGVIAKVENLPDATMLEMVHFPLRRHGRPMELNESIGRFRVYVDGFMDPMVYKPGRSMTFAGHVIGVENGSVGDQAYLFPAMNADGYYLWRDAQQVEISGLYIWPHPYFHRYHYGFHTGWPYRYHRYRATMYTGDRGKGGHTGTRNSGSSNSGTRNSGPRSYSGTSATSGNRRASVTTSSSRRDKER